MVWFLLGGVERTLQHEWFLRHESVPAVFNGDKRTMWKEVTESKGRHDEKPHHDRSWTWRCTTNAIVSDRSNVRGAIRICRAEEAATKTEEGMALPSPKMSNYRREKQNRGVTKVLRRKSRKTRQAEEDVRTAVGTSIHIQRAQPLKEVSQKLETWPFSCHLWPAAIEKSNASIFDR